MLAWQLNLMLSLHQRLIHRLESSIPVLTELRERGATCSMLVALSPSSAHVHLLLNLCQTHLWVEESTPLSSLQALGALLKHLHAHPAPACPSSDQ